MSTILAALSLLSLTLPQQPAELSGVVAVPPAKMVPGHGGGSTSNVGKNLRLNQDSTTRWQNEFGLAVNPTNPDNFLATANDYRAGDARGSFYASLDGGRSIVSDGIFPLTSPFQASGDPSVDFDGFGNGYILVMQFRRSFPRGGGLFVHRTADGGKTFPFTGKVFQGASTHLPDKPYIGIDRRTSGLFAGSIYVTFTGFFTSPSGINVLHSRDRGKTWSQPQRLGFGQGSQPVVGPNGEVYVTWMSGRSVLFRVSTNGGVSFGPTRTVAVVSPNPRKLPPTRFRTPWFPSMAVDRSKGPFRGRIHIIWSSQQNFSAEIFGVFSSNGGLSWSAPKRLNDKATGDQFFQWVTVDENGTVFASWFDRRNDPTNRSHDCYATASYDGGKTWLANKRVSDRASNPGNSTFIGDYSGLGAGGGRFFPTWVDFRRGNQDAFTAPVQADLEFAPVSLSAATGGRVGFTMRAGPAHAGARYFLVAGLSGTMPGVNFGNGVIFHLNPDPLIGVSLMLGNTTTFVNTLGTLGSGGIPARQPAFVVPPALLRPAMGRNIDFAYLLISGSNLSYGSQAASILIKP